MPTLEQLMAEVLDTPSQTQKKEASVKSASTAEIDKVLEGLGLGDEGSVKTASENINETGGNMQGGSLTELLYGELLGENAAAAAPAEKVASAAASNGALEVFGEAAGHYFNVALDAYIEKAASEVAIPSAGMGNPDPMSASAVGKSLGAAGESPRIHTNHSDAMNHAAPNVTVQNHGAYDETLKEKAAILSRIKGQGQVGTKKV